MPVYSLNTHGLDTRTGQRSDDPLNGASLATQWSVLLAHAPGWRGAPVYAPRRKAIAAVTVTAWASLHCAGVAAGLSG